MKRYIKSSNTTRRTDYRNLPGDNFTGIHPIVLLVFPNMATWFEEDHFENLGSILGIDADELKLLMARFFGFEGDPDDWNYTTFDFYDFFDAKPKYLKILNDYIDSHRDEVSEALELLE